MLLFSPLVLLLAGCGSVDPSGTWMFTRSLTLATGAECTEPSVSHNFSGAYTPEAAADEDAWTEESTETFSGDVFFGSVERTATGAVLVVDTLAFPGVEGEEGAWTFSWSREDQGEDASLHTTGYAWSYSYQSTVTTRVSGTFGDGTFSGTWEEESATVDSWVESDDWADEVAETIGGTGNIPSGDYLVKTDELGAETAATNTQLVFDCASESCTLSVAEACLYSYPLEAVRTEHDGADGRWVQEAGQGAGGVEEEE